MEVKTEVMSHNVIALRLTTCNLCTCLGQWQDMFGLTYDEMAVKDVFRCCTNVEISDGDNPFYLCTTCTMKLIGTYEFIKTCKEAWKTHTQTFSQKDDYEILQTIEKQENEDDPDQDPEVVSNASDCYEEECDDSDKEDQVTSEEIKQIMEEPIELIEVTIPEVEMDLTSDRCKTQEDFDERVYKEIEALHINDAQKKETIVDNNWDVITGNKKLTRKRKTYQCSLCRQEFTVKRKFNRHVRNHAERKNLCEPCNILFKTPLSLKQHKFEEHNQDTKCFLCSTIMPTIKDLKRHLFTEHEDIQATGPINSETNPKTEAVGGASALTCHVCGKVCKGHHYLKQHLYSHLTMRSRVCKICGERFPSYSQYKLHLSVHINNKSYRCSVCFKSFKAKVGLIYHMRSAHTNSRPHLCHICGKDFVQQAHLSIHQKIHSDEKTFMCELCGKSFRLKATLTVHLRTHTGEKRYGCDKCDKRYTSLKNLKKHKAVCGIDVMIRRRGKSL